MTPLWKQIEQLRPESAGQNLEFIPSKLLYSLLTTEVVSGAVDNCDSIPPYRRNETVERIIKGGRRLFAILVLLKGKEGLIVNFIEHDQFQRSSLDLRLPLPINILENTVPEIASNFYDMQWQLLSPIFSKNTIHRSLHDRIRLPFVYEKEIGSGGFGTVYEVVIHSSHQKLPTVSNIYFVIDLMTHHLTRSDISPRINELFERNSAIFTMNVGSTKLSCITLVSSMNSSIQIL